MREYQPVGVLVAAAATAANGNYTYAATASNDLLSLPVESPISVDSQFSLLTTASSPTVSSGLPTQQCDWPEFQENYNSIMDNTNLLDSCAAALNDISNENGLFTTVQTDKLRHEFNRSLSSSTTASSFSESDATEVTTKCTEQYMKWLCDMECRVAAQPKLSKIIAMKPKQKVIQLEIHTNIFKEIATRPFNVKISDENDYKSIEERYHLLYLKVYEVLLLLDGLPTKSSSPSKHILSESFHNYGCNTSDNDAHGNQSSSSSSSSSLSTLSTIDNEVELIFDKTHLNVTTPAYTETNILSTSIGTYYFNYDDTIEQQQQQQQQIDNKRNAKLSSTIHECNDKEFTFDHDLHSLLNASDSFGQKSREHVSVMSNEQQHLVDRDNIDGFGNTLSTAHDKVSNWLKTSTDPWKSKSLVNLDCSIASEGDYRLIYRAKSEIDLSVHRPVDQKNMESSLYTSLICLPSVMSPMKQYGYYETKLNESFAEDSLVWDNFQMGDDSSKVDNDTSLIGNDSETKELSNQLCYFGDDYSLHLNEMNNTDGELDSYIEIIKPSVEDGKAKKQVETPLSTASPSSNLTQKGSKIAKRSRSNRKKRSRNYSNASTAHSSSSAFDYSSNSNLFATTTISADSLKHCENIQTNQSADEFTPDTTISYNSNEKQFEVHTKQSGAPKKMKINEMRPEDFYDIVKMCQSNIDCVITVLGADPNRILTVAYCQQMKCERYQKSDAATTTMTTCKCKQQPKDANDLMVNSPKTKKKCAECKCNSVSKADSIVMCICAWVSQTIAMILNFLMDCWNIFRNLKLYTYLCQVTKALFGSTRYVADHLRSKHGLLADVKAIKYS